MIGCDGNEPIGQLIRRLQDEVDRVSRLAEADLSELDRRGIPFESTVITGICYDPTRPLPPIPDHRRDIMSAVAGHLVPPKFKWTIAQSVGGDCRLIITEYDPDAG